MTRFKIFIILLLLSGCNLPLAEKEQPSGYYLVTKVVDGDTFWVDDNSEKGLKIRLIGVDAPESRNTGRKKKAPFGQESREFLKQLLSGQFVRLEYDAGKTDRYGRTLAYVYMQDGTFVNAQLVKQGYAQVMTVPPNVKYVELFLQLQREAREAGRGLWGISPE